MATSDELGVVSLSTENVQFHVHRPRRRVMTASTFTNEVGLVSHRLDVACENQQLVSRRKPRNVTRVVAKTLTELRESWELFSVETVNTVMVDRTLQESSVDSAVPSSLPADQQPEHSVDTDSSQPDKSDNVVSVQSSTVSTVASQVVASNLHTDVTVVETYSSISSAMVKSQGARGTTDVGQVPEHDGVERYDLLVNVDSRAVDGGIETSERRLPLSPEELLNYERSHGSVGPVGPVGSSLGDVSKKLDVSCENQQLFSGQKPKNVLHVVDVTLDELRETWRLFCLETMNTVAVNGMSSDKHESSVIPTDTRESWELDSPERVTTVVDDGTLHKSSVTDALTSGLTTGQEPERSVESDLSQPTSISDTNDLNKPLVSSINASVVTTRVSEDVSSYSQAVERDSDLSPQTVRLLKDEKAIVHDQLQERNDDDNSGIEASDYGLPLSPEEVPSHKPAGESALYDAGQTADLDIKVVEKLSQPAYELLGADVDHVDTQMSELVREGEIEVSESYTGIPDRIHPGTNSLELSEVEMKPSHADVVADEEPVHVSATDETRDITFLHAGAPGQSTHIGDKDLDADTLQTSDNATIDATEQVYADKHPHDDRIGDGYGLETMPCDDETGVDKVDTHPGDGYGPETMRRDDETSVDRVDTHPGDGYGLETMPQDDTYVMRVPKVLVSESAEGVIMAAEQPAFLEGGTCTYPLGTEDKPAGVFEAGFSVPHDNSSVLEIRQVLSSELDENNVRKPVAAVDVTGLSQSEHEAFTEMEREHGEGETAAAGPVESVDIKYSDDGVTRQQPSSEVLVFVLRVCIFALLTA